MPDTFRELGERSVHGHGGIDSIGPGVDTASQILELGEAVGLQEADRLRAASAVVAMGDDQFVAVRLQFGITRHELAERQQDGAVDMGVVVLVLLAYVDQHEVGAGGHLVIQLGHGNLFNHGRSPIGTGCFGFTQLGYRGVGGADGAVRLLCHGQLAPGHGEGIVQQKPAGQRFTDASDVFDRFCCLRCRDGSGEDAEYACFGAVRNCLRRRWLGEQATIAWPGGRAKQR